MKHCKFYPFMKAVQGNWRNSLYLSCGCKACPFGQNAVCEGFLLAFDAASLPILISITEFRRVTGEDVDPAECCGTLSRESFEAVCRQHIFWQQIDPSQCPTLTLSGPVKCTKD